MAFLSETETWVEGIYQIEEEDPVMGGPDGIDNRPNRELACRTRFLKKQVEELQNSEKVEDHNSDVNAHTAAFALHNADPKAHGSISGVPVGTILLFPAHELPEGFMPCDGTYLSRTAYPDLYKTIGTRYGEGDGISTFNLPDLRGYFVRGLDDGKGIDPNREIGSVQNDSFAYHNHAFSESGGAPFGILNINYAGTSVGTISDLGTGNSVQSGSLSYAGENENRPKNVAMVYAIKVFGAAINEGEVDLQELTASVAELTNTLQQPAGSVLAFAGPTPPSGYLVCNGNAVGRETYPDLFEAIGTTYGSGDGLTTFNLPDFRGEFLRGVDLGKGVDIGRTLGSSQGDAIRNITGRAGNVAVYKGYSASGAMQVDDNPDIFHFPQGTTVAGTGIYFDASHVVPTAEENRPRNIAILYCIKAWGSKINPGQIDLTALASEVAGMRKKLTDHLNLYVREDGNDTNNGLSNTPEGAFRSIPAAWKAASTKYDLADFYITINIGEGTFEGGPLHLRSFVGGSPIVAGKGKTTKITGGFHPYGEGSIVIQDVSFIAQSNQNVVSCASNATLDLRNYIGVENNAPGAAAFITGSDGYMRFYNAQVYIDSSELHSMFTVHFSSTIDFTNTVINHTTPLVVNTYCHCVQGLVVLVTPVVFNGSNNVSGLKFGVDINGSIYTNGAGKNLFPGTIPGTLKDGGIYF